MPDCMPQIIGREEGVTLLGYSWDQADEAKMLSTFGLGRAVFASFLDLQEVASALGYRGGLNWLTQQVLGVDIPKSKRVGQDMYLRVLFLVVA